MHVFLCIKGHWCIIKKHFYKEVILCACMINLLVVILVIVIGSVWQARFCFSVEQVEGKVNINTATEAQIALLPGIGPKLVTEVVNYRTNNGALKPLRILKGKWRGG